jgi:PAS domain S-box-containing protein
MPSGTRTQTASAFTEKDLCAAVLGSASDAVIASDSAGIVRFWNPGAERIFGFDRNEAIGRSLDIIIPERLRERHWTGYRRVVASGESRYGAGAVLAVPGIRKDGSQVSLEFTLIPLRGEAGDLVGMAAIVRDVTARFEELQMLRNEVARLTKARCTDP